LELYQDAVHVFHLFAPFDPFAHYAIKRLSTFIKSHTGISKTTEPDRKAMYIQNVKNEYPQQELKDVQGILEDGLFVLVQKGSWDIENNKVMLKSING
jgi:hypothetical protein